mgnify:CR=1 FL=1
MKLLSFETDRGATPGALVNGSIAGLSTAVDSIQSLITLRIRLTLSTPMTSNCWRLFVSLFITKPIALR